MEAQTGDYEDLVARLPGDLVPVYLAETVVAKARRAVDRAIADPPTEEEAAAWKARGCPHSDEQVERLIALLDREIAIDRRYIKEFKAMMAGRGGSDPTGHRPSMGQGR